MITVRQDCADHEFDTSAVEIQNRGDGTLSWSINNLMGPSFPWIQIVFVGSDDTLQSSGRVEFAHGGSTVDYTSKCNGDVSSIDVYLPMETMEEDSDVCTGWDPESDICRYKIEFSCECGSDNDVPTSGPTSAPTSSPAPTVCKEIELQHEEPLIDWPLDAGPEMVDRDIETGVVTIGFNQTFNTTGSPDCLDGQIDWVAFVDESNTVCNIQENICHGAAIETAIQCADGEEYAMLTVYVSSSDATFSAVNNTKPDFCSSWTETGSDSNVAKYVFEVPCNSDPCRVEATDPTAGPTSGPTSSPTPERPICVDDVMVEIVGQDGLGSVTCNGTVLEITDTDLPVEVLERSPDGDNVTFRVNQLFYDDTIAKLSVLHRYNSTSQECESESEIEYGWNETYTAHCFEDEAQITIYMYLCDVDELTECENCQRPDNFTNFLEYTFSVSCLPECVHCEETPAAECPDDVELVESIGVTEYQDAHAPIRVLEQNTSTVTFTIDNFLEVDLEDMFIQYHYTAVGDTICENQKGVSACGSNMTYTAFCMSRTPVTIVDLWISDSHLDVSDSGTVPRCCHPDESDSPVVQYSFLIHCETQCPEVPPVRLLSDEEREGAIEGFYKSSHRGQMSSPLQITAKGGHYCSKEDHPCGANNENVHVCHYSARDGYQTFCVPEDDTDILAYYPKDHCGPCFGGFANPTV